jgi:hypothetical protein
MVRRIATTMLVAACVSITLLPTFGDDKDKETHAAVVALKKEGDDKGNGQMKELKKVTVKREVFGTDTDEERLKLARASIVGREFGKITPISKLTTRTPFASEEKGALSFISPYLVDALNGVTYFNQPKGVEFRKGSGVCLGFKPKPNGFYLATFDVFDASGGKQEFEIDVLGYSKSVVKNLKQGKIYVFFQAWNGNTHLLYVLGNVGEMWNFYNCELFELGQ